MNWQSLKKPHVQDFIASHTQDDVAKLALKKPPAFITDYPLVLAQIKARQKAAIKVPQWAENKEIIFPEPGLVEQASSNATALYKASLVNGENFIDLTAGMGIDSWALSRSFKEGTCIEQNKHSSELLEHNFKALGLSRIHIHNETAEEALKGTKRYDLAYIDPQRRDQNTKGKFLLEATSPNILELMPVLKIKARIAILKASPMLDISQCCAQLKEVREVHILEWKGDCKEVLYIMDFQTTPGEEIPVISALLNDYGESAQKFSTSNFIEKNTICDFSEPLTCLFEPSPSVQKSGGFKSLAKTYNLKKLHPHTHLYTSDHNCRDFPGRSFKILDIFSASEKRLPVRQANITIRNFPETLEHMRKRLKIKDGGPDTLFACTLINDKKVLVHCQKC